ncbi:MAG: hypothetical protein ACOZCL_13065 [Bacillota bacterium]
MDFLIVLSIAAIFVCTTAVMVMKLLFKSKSTEILCRINTTAFLILIPLVSVYPFKGMIVTMETISFCYMLGFLAAVLWEILLDGRQLKYWAAAWFTSSMIYALSTVLKYTENTLISNLVDFGVIFIPSLLIITIICFIKKSSHGPLAVKALTTAYLTFGALFALLPPIDIFTVALAILGVLLVGLIPAVILRFFYRRIYIPSSAIEEMITTNEA